MGQIEPGLYESPVTRRIEDVLAVMLYAYQRFGCRQFVLDSLMRFSGLDGDGQEIWNAQKGFMDRLVDFARTYNVHIHLVAHSKKPNDRRGEAIIPRRYDVMGSSYISNLAFNGSLGGSILAHPIVSVAGWSG